MCGFLTKDNFELAFYRLYTAKRDYYKELYFDDLKNFGLDLDDNIELLIELINEKIYKPYKTSKIYLPKDSGLLRKITVINFVDLLVYQAIMNIIAKKFYDDVSVFYNYITFSNFLVEDLDYNKFFFKKWSKCWNAFRKKIKQYLNEGYTYVGEFDIASFYDTIDHSLLMKILKSKDNDIEWINMLDVLESQLKEWSNDSDRTCLKLSHGIPQGPLGSALLGEIYLNYLDVHMKDKLDLEGDFKYIRYVDDIRVFAKDKHTVEKWLRYVELLVNDLGLIPQYNKSDIKNIGQDKVNEYIKSQFDELSVIDKYFRETGELKSKQNRRLVKSVKETIEEQKFDKTIIKFSLYKVKKDDQLKNMLIKNYDKMLACFDGICYYLAKHFSDDVETRNFVFDLLQTVAFDEYIISTLLKYFIKHIEFSIDIFNILQKNRNWYVIYFLIDWLKYYKKLGLIMSEEKRNLYSFNIYLQKKVLSYQVLSEDDVDVKRELIIEMMKSDIPIIALEGLKLYYQFFGLEEITFKEDMGRLNKFVSVNINKDTDKKINYALNFFETEYGIENARYLFNTEVINEEDLDNLNLLLFNANKIENIDYSSWLSYINSFNHNLVISLLKKGNVNIDNRKDYENNLKHNNFKNIFPVAYKNFDNIRKRRNSLPPNHPYEDDKEYAKPLTENEKKYYKDLEATAIREISNKCYTLYFSNREEVAYTLYDDYDDLM